jgi:putative phosphoribosyl transferase
MDPVTRSADVVIPSDDASLAGALGVPAGATRLVVFAHGSGSSRLSPRNAAVAAALHAGGIATLLFDLLTEDEARDRANVFDIDLLASRLGDAVGWAAAREDVGGLPLGLFGASTGAAAAIVAAAARPDAVFAVVSRGGRPDLAGHSLGELRSPTLLIVGGRDETVLGLNRDAMRAATLAHVELEVVPGAGHLFEEPGALERVEALATRFFRRHG